MLSDYVFIVGAPRSGTTLLRAMLNRHPRIGLCDETYYHYWVNSRRRIFGDLSDPRRRARLIDRYLATSRIQRLGLDLDALRTRLLSDGVDYPRFFAALIEFYAGANGKPRAGEKTPEHALIARQLLSWYPNARLVNIIRDPRDVVASLQRMPWGRQRPYLNARLWRDCVVCAGASRDDERFLTVRYEDLIAEPVHVLGKVCGFIGEPFDQRMLHATDERSDRWWFDRAQRAVDGSRIERWREDLSPGNVAEVELVAGDLMAAYGYSRSQPPMATTRQVGTRLAATASDVWQRVGRPGVLYWRWFRPDQLASEERAMDRRGHRALDRGGA